jgi:hypothetical protein
MEENKTTEPKIITDDDIIDYTLKTLYANLDKNDLHLEKDILMPMQLNLTPKQIEHIREVMLATNLVNAGIGFGRSSNVHLSNLGMQVMKTYNGYIPYVQYQQQQMLVQMLPLMQQQQMAQQNQLVQLPPNNNDIEIEIGS